MNAPDECAENIKILERGFDAYLTEYREQSEIWNTLETKAQGLIATAGLFLAAAFAFSRAPLLNTPTKLLVFATLWSLCWSILASLAVLRAAEFQMPDGSDAVAKAIKPVATPMENCGTRYQAYLANQLDDANAVLSSLDSVNSQKQAQLAHAQSLLALAAFLSVAATLLNMTWPGRPL